MSNLILPCVLILLTQPFTSFTALSTRNGDISLVHFTGNFPLQGESKEDHDEGENYQSSSQHLKRTSKIHIHIRPEVAVGHALNLTGQRRVRSPFPDFGFDRDPKCVTVSFPSSLKWESLSGFPGESKSKLLENCGL